MTKESLTALEKVAVRFTADWCGPCKVFAPTFEKVAEEFKEDVSSVVINVGTEEGQALCQTYSVLGIPAVVFLRNGNVTNLMIGNQPTPEVQKAFQKLKDEA